MNVCILGCARSGTTALYSFLQHIMEEHYPQQVEYVYEPFLWDYHVFNGKYNEMVNKFNFVDSLSFEGIYHHLQLPLFIDDPTPYQDNDYLCRLFYPGTAGKSLLFKFIRANGRYLLLNRISPETKFIFILRNPADTVNSIFRLFSFYGGELHRDDFSRFFKELNAIYKKRFSKENFKILAEKELLYWYYMNKFALESFEKTDNKPLILCHEEKINDRGGFTRKICQFLEIPFNEGYLERSGLVVGYNTKRIDISKSEFDLFSQYLDMYRQLLTDHNVDYPVDKSRILDKYEVSEDKSPREHMFYGLTALKIIDNFKHTQYELSQKTALLGKKEKLLIKKTFDLERSLMTIQMKDEQLKKRANSINQKNQLVKQKDSAIKKLDRLISRKGKDIDGLNQLIEQKDAALKERDQMLEEKNTAIRQRDRLLQQKDVVFQEQEQLLSRKNAAIRERDQLLSQKDAAIRERDRLLAEKHIAIRERDQLIEQKKSAIQEQDRLLEQKKSAIREQDRLLEQKNSAVRKRDNLIKQINITVKERDARIRDKDKKIEELEDKFNQLYNSYSWKIGFAVTRIVKFLFGWIPFVKKRKIK